MTTNGKRAGIIAVIGLIGISGCSSSLWKSPNQMDEQKHTAFGQAAVKQRGEEQGKWESAADSGKASMFQIGGEDGILGMRGKGKGSKDEVRADKLFSGALAVIMELPISVANREGGIITTDWKTDPNNVNIRYRVNIRVSGKEPYGEVQVAVLKQELVHNNWVDRNPDQQMATSMEKAIRQRSQDQRP